ncbi:hypothetical protein IGI04_023678 [Brassica rapa subsp. trilocularis]|uniref:Uncharacterized protein n=1 Tax=Brassica rapa subsp. trilocularis TaxID=1813537 RepID=A0ABQ7M753_BRACM|nr:hypothetical protein IGI04_023678 [Brassica rapa subsp. trilocularis]
MALVKAISPKFRLFIRFSLGHRLLPFTSPSQKIFLLYTGCLSIVVPLALSPSH